MGRADFEIDGMACEACAERIRKLLSREPGVRTARVSFAEGSVAIRFDPSVVGEPRLREIIERGGFHVRERSA